MKSKISFKPIAVLMILLTVTLALLSSTDIKANAGIYGGDGVGVNGGNISWSVNTVSGVLTISGSGEMKEFTEENDLSPWRYYDGLINAVIIEDGITCISDYALYKMTGVTKITVPDSVTEIGAYAFGYCTSLTEIIIPDSVTEIGECAFTTCNALERMTLPFAGRSYVKGSGITYYEPFGYIFGAEYFGDGNVTVQQIAHNADNGNSSTVYYYLPKSLTEITVTGGRLEKYVFMNCANFTKITLGDGVTEIGESAFRGCRTLVSINIPDGVTEIRDYTFATCGWLSDINIPDSVTRIGERAFDECHSLIKFTIGNGVTEIGENAFYNCSRLKEIVIGRKMKLIRGFAFYSCTAIEKVEITDVAAWCDIIFESKESSPLFLGASLYLNGEKLTELVIPDGVEKINDWAFTNCKGILSVDFPDSITQIPENAFSGCSDLTSVTFGSGVKDIGNNAFEKCTSMEIINIPDGVARIGDYAFYNCYSLTKVTVGNGVTEIGKYAFQNCYKLKEVAIGSGVEFIGQYAFANCYELKKIEITDLAAWCGIVFKIAESNPLYYGSASLYVNGEKVTELVIPHGVEKINAWAFVNCNGLLTVDIPNSVTLISERAFNGCPKLSAVTLGHRVSVIERNAFLGCPSLKTVDFEDWRGWWTENETVFGEELSNSPEAARLLAQYADRIWYKGNAPELPPPPPDYTWVANAVGLSALGVMLLVIAVFVLKKKRV